MSAGPSPALVEVAHETPRLPRLPLKPLTGSGGVAQRLARAWARLERALRAEGGGAGGETAMCRAGTWEDVEQPPGSHLDFPETCCVALLSPNVHRRNLPAHPRRPGQLEALRMREG